MNTLMGCTCAHLEHHLKVFERCGLVHLGEVRECTPFLRYFSFGPNANLSPFGGAQMYMCTYLKGDKCTLAHSTHLCTLDRYACALVWKCTFIH